MAFRKARKKAGLTLWRTSSASAGFAMPGKLDEATSLLCDHVRGTTPERPRAVSQAFPRLEAAHHPPVYGQERGAARLDRLAGLEPQVAVVAVHHHLDETPGFDVDALDSPRDSERPPGGLLDRVEFRTSA